MPEETDHGVRPEFVEMVLNALVEVVSQPEVAADELGTCMFVNDDGRKCIVGCCLQTETIDWMASGAMCPEGIGIDISVSWRRIGVASLFNEIERGGAGDPYLIPADDHIRFKIDGPFSPSERHALRLLQSAHDSLSGRLMDGERTTRVWHNLSPRERADVICRQVSASSYRLLARRMQEKASTLPD